MNIREAILKAADHIERNPAAYCFSENDMPTCGTPGCLMGWIGFYAGVKPTSACYMGAVRKALGFDYGDIGAFVRSFNGNVSHERYMHLMDYQDDARVGAEVLRMYADKYHPAESPAVSEVASSKWIRHEPGSFAGTGFTPRAREAL